MKPKRANKPSNHPFTLFSDWRLYLYNFAIVVFSPYLLLKKVNKAIQRRNLNEFLKARCTTPLYRPLHNDCDTLRVMFICSGFGESQACAKLTMALKLKYPKLHVVVAVRDHDGIAAILQNNCGATVTLSPFDFWPFVKLWFQKNKPDVVVAMRLLWLPNIVWASQLWGAQMCAIGVPPRKYKPARFKMWAAVNRWTLRGYNAVGFLSEADKQDHLSFFDKSADVRVTGTTRFLQSHSSNESLSELRSWIHQSNPNNLPLIVAGSLRRGEPEFILEAFEDVCVQQQCLLLVAPRNINDVEAIEQLLLQRNLCYTLRSQYTVSHKAETFPKVLILDTMGELSQAYSFGSVSYVGGTLRGRGHNIYEPLEWEVPVFLGPGNGHPHVSQQPALDAGVGFIVNSSQELAHMWLRVLKDKEYQLELKQRCHEFIEQQQEGFQKNLQIIIDMIELKSK